jgi:UDP-2-acetamido-2-deoxy-ribo-hexuluronate aminotransferase
VHYPVPLTRQPALAAYTTEAPRAAAAASRVISLPMSPWLSVTEQDSVIAHVRAAV